MNKTLNTIGILLVAIGTILTLWTILSTKTKYAGTYAELGDRCKKFPKEKNKVIFGTILIIVGSLSQIIGLWI
jgi:hypothetical protein